MNCGILETAFYLTLEAQFINEGMKMLSVKGIYDGKKILLLDEVKISSPRKVIVTFLEESEEGEIQKEIYASAEKSSSFEFLKEPEEDIYTDNDLKARYKSE
ncbi:MAG: hypothetical protein HYS25_16935 [Ignavibacteriales bacterium]|nr:hypothetical protein [Ignavibacteriales bacterium]